MSDHRAPEHPATAQSTSDSDRSRVLVGSSDVLARALLSGLPADEARSLAGRLDGAGSAETGMRRRRGPRHPEAGDRPSTLSSQELDQIASEPWHGA